MLRDNLSEELCRLITIRVTVCVKQNEVDKQQISFFFFASLGVISRRGNERDFVGNEAITGAHHM